MAKKKSLSWIVIAAMFMMAFVIIHPANVHAGINGTEFWSCPDKPIKIIATAPSNVSGVSYTYSGPACMKRSGNNFTFSEEGTWTVRAEGHSPFVLDYTIKVHIAHDFDDEYTIDSEPTCTQPGSESIHCKNCNVKKDDIEIPAKGHVWEVEETIDLEPTCTEDGIKSIHCSSCEAIKNESAIPMLGHDIIHHEGRAVTCTSYGYKEYDTCSRCKYTTYQRIDATGHTLGDWVVTTQETATRDGYKQRNCLNCAYKEGEAIPKKSWLTCNLDLKNLFDRNSESYQDFMYSDMKSTSTVGSGCTGIAKRIILKKESIILFGLLNKRSWYSGMNGYMGFCPGCGCETLTGVGTNANGEYVSYTCSNKKHNCPYSKTTISKYKSSTAYISISRTPYIQDNIASCSATTGNSADTEIELDPGTYYIIIYSRNLSGYSGLVHDISAYATYMETSIDVSDLTISYNKTVCYSGKPVQLNPVVKYLDYTLEEGSDYVLSYNNNDGVGNAEFVVEGQGIFTGTKRGPFNIVNHAWDAPTYSWGKNCASATAVRACKNDASHKQTETVKTTSIIIKSPTYTTKGQRKYTAVFKNAFFEKQTKDVSDVPMLKKVVQPMKVKAVTKTVRVNKLKKKAQTIKPLTVKGAKGKVTYKVVGGNAKSKRILALNKKNGKITVKKRSLKGTFRIKVKVAAAGNYKYRAGSKTIWVTVKVK